MLVACLALAISLSGVAYAAATIGAADIKRNAVHTRHIDKGAVTGGKIRDGAVGLHDLALDAQPLVRGYEVVLEPGVLASNQSGATFEANCPEGKTVLGGGYAIFNDKIQVMASTPLEDFPRRWIVTVETFDGSPVGTNSSVNVRIVCAFAD